MGQVGVTGAFEPAALVRRGLTAVPSPGLGDKLRRLGWRMVQGTLYRWSPAPLHGWRRMLLRLFGAKVGPGAHPYPDAQIWSPWTLTMGARSCLGPASICYNVGLVELGEDAIVSQYAYLCGATHDHRDPAFPLVIGPISIGAGAWVAADAFVGPGVRVGDGAVVGARAVLMRDAPAGMVLSGNPAQVTGAREVRDPARNGR